METLASHNLFFKPMTKVSDYVTEIWEGSLTEGTHLAFNFGSRRQQYGELYLRWLAAVRDFPHLDLRFQKPSAGAYFSGAGLGMMGYFEHEVTVEDCEREFNRK